MVARKNTFESARIELGGSMTNTRRDFLQGGLALSIATAMPCGKDLAATSAYSFDPEPGAWRTFEITTRVEIETPRGGARAWIPLPSIAADDWIRPLGNKWTISDGTATASQVGRYGTKLLQVQWPKDGEVSSVEVLSRVATRDRSVHFGKPGNALPLSEAERRLFLSPTELIPTDGIVKNTALKIVAGANTDEQKARRLYEWTITNTLRDPKTRGCGVGDIASMLRTGTLAGKCADLNALYVGMARACAIPARDLYGIRVAPSRFGFRSLGTSSAVITKAQHCRAEIYLTDFGWVPVDPADVRKVVLEEPPGNLPIEDSRFQAARKTLFGAWEMNWIAYNYGHDVALPGSDGPPIGFLMYPQAEAGGEMRDCLSADTFQYAITSREVI
jgi:transglutaminase-like putative cysteine protease